MSEIIGKRFRRNKYGLSLWEDRVSEVVYHRELPGNIRERALYYKNMSKNKGLGEKLVPKVIGVNTLGSYSFDEIIFYND